MALTRFFSPDQLCADSHPELNDDEALQAELIFDELARINPAAVEKAQSP